MNIFTKAMMMDHNMIIENTLDWIITEVDASFVEVKDESVDKRNSIVDTSLLVLTEIVDVLFHPMLIREP